MEEKAALKLKKTKKEVEKEVCQKCKKIVKKMFLRCGNCRDVFHFTCVPKKHKIHVPEEEEDDFLCHNCYLTDEDQENYSDASTLPETRDENESEDITGIWEAYQDGRKDLGV